MILTSSIYTTLDLSAERGEKQLAVLIDPDKFLESEAECFLSGLPGDTTHIFVGGSTVAPDKTQKSVRAIKLFSDLPVVLFPGDHTQITEQADALLFLSLISGRNPEYLIEQQVKSVEKLRNSTLEIIPTGYILIDGGNQCAVHRISQTLPIPQNQVDLIINTALAGQFSGKKLIYLEAGSGAQIAVSEEIISAVKDAINIPLIVGGGIRTQQRLMKSYDAGADMVVIGTAFEQYGLSI
ncbi:geranylgeranylglyceryl/heptaprenylglyceryl phosphate synthase [Gillisia sp. Q332]|uniref:geranylgeranylglyceryl/heptaprenylglyceryl phosphate synthase n=1 Tax=Gillisia xinjiangensis TaxID=3384765 RepID=UPI0039199136